MSVATQNPSTQTIAKWRGIWRHEATAGLVGLLVLFAILGKPLGWKVFIAVPVLVAAFAVILMIILIPLSLLRRDSSQRSLQVAMPDGWRLVSGKLRIDASGLTWTPNRGGAPTAQVVNVAAAEIDHFETGRPYGFVYNRYYCECVLRDGASLTFVSSSTSKLQRYLGRQA